ncbi:heme A synthase [Pigmentiphaga sp. NML080357]|uniref:COX15/CtaA family protein n=1 Tax=Pigmentiphaga sp. NML080357 TaxID=2008675 RepID=UPI000B41F91B|nr:COX15/CtaA family protein [Pigmentiphaga sp. NML080357]OVZ55512.1 heme A synthase [Pigmentiphaga sp. NML080357]
METVQPSADRTARIRARYAKLVAVTMFLTFDLIMFGAFVRLTDSGLGCPDWPGCYGKASPIGALHDIHAAAAAMPEGPVTLSKAWIEMVHRYAGTLLGILIIAIVVMAWRHRKALAQSPWLATVILPAVCLQGAFGAWTVTHLLMPAVVTAHLLGGISLLALLTWLSARQTVLPDIPGEAGRWWGYAAFGLALLYTQLALGGWVSTNYAALACMDFPTCHGQWVPEMDFHGGYSILRALGELPSGEIISQSALTAIHWTHRNFAFVVLVYLGWLALKLRRYDGLRGPSHALLAMLGVQLLTGLTSIFLQWPIVIAVLHNGGAAVLTVLCVTLLVRLSRVRRAPDYRARAF